MSKQIKFEWQNKPYTLEFTRASVKKLERQGFSISEAKDKPMTFFPELFSAAFVANHPFIKKEIIDEIFENVCGKAGLVEKLIELYQEPFNTLMDDPEESEKNVKWEASW